MKTITGYIFLLFLLIGVSQIACSQQMYTSEVLTVDDGLCFRRVNSIIQDHQGLMWFGTSKGLSRFDGHRFVNFTKNAIGDKNFQWDQFNDDAFVFRDDSTLWMIVDYQLVSMNINNFKTKLISGIDGKALMFLSGVENHIWFITDNGIKQFLWRFTEQEGFKKISSVPHFRTELSEVNQDSLGQIWWSSTTQGLQKYDSEGNLLGVDSNFEDLYFHDEHTTYTDFYIDSQNRFFVYSMKKQGVYELWQYNPETGQKKVLADGYKNFSFVASEDSWGHIWFGMDQQLLQLRSNDQVVNYSNTFPPNFDYSVIHSIFEDRNHMLWIGTNGGVLKMPINKKVFDNYFVNEGLGISHSIRGIGESKEGDLFFFHNTGIRGFYRLDQNSKKVIKVNFGMSDLDLFNLISLATYFIYDEKRNCIWAMCKSLMKLNLETEQIEIQSEANMGLDHTDYNPLALRSDGLILIGNTLDQVALYNPETRSLKKILTTTSNQTSEPIVIKTLLPVGNDRFWVSTLNHGIYLFDIEGQELKHYHTRSIPAINNNHVICIYQDKEWLWLGTFGGGLSSIHLPTGEIREYTQQDGLCDDHVVSILSEGDNLWLGTYNGLSCLNIKEETFRNYYEEDGLTDNEFNFSSFFKSKDGKMHFGGMNGINSFYPSDLLETGSPPDLILTRFTKHDQKTDKIIHFQSNENLEGPFVISPDISYFQFEWSLLSYLNHKKIQYSTWLEGLEEDWTSVGNTANLRFNKLPPGEYTLHLKAKDSKGNWSENPLTIPITVVPPWWKTWWAYSLFILLTIGTAAFFWLRETRRLQLKNQLEKESLESVRLRELDETKTRLIANISHEFRTPLTIISGMAEQMEESPGDWFQQGVPMIKRSANRLLSLVNQMLDLSKLESGKMALHLHQGDLIKYLKYIIESIHSFAASKNIKVHFLCEEDEVHMDFDQEKIQQVIVNLLSNAIKFTPTGGDVYVSVRLIPVLKIENTSKENRLQIKIKDTGIGIPAAQIPNIFDRFYQVDDTESRHDEGTGIGLALVKELIKLMNGDISVKSKVGRDTVFTLLLPIINKTDPLDLPIRQTNSEVNAGNTKSPNAYAKGQPLETLNGSKPRLLLVEDNADVVTYVTSCLQVDYNIQVGKDGDEGIQIAFENIPDLIITDVMMPAKDGFEVTQTLKSDERTSHIPIIMLTAKADIESKLEGLSMGADAYLAKPFHKKELLIRIEKLLELRKNLQKHYLISLGLSTQKSDTSNTEIAVLEDPFGQKLKSIIQSYIDDTEFTVQQLCKAIGMSHSQLHRKITALTGLSPVKFIRQVRLNNAKELLQSSDMTVAGVAFNSGFSDPSYFARVFKKEFGVSPLEWKSANY